MARQGGTTADAPPNASHTPVVDSSTTPSMAQYIEIKAANPDCLLFYRMGDFYELFFDDAVAASQALGIALTKRGKHRGEDIPMAGVPVARGDEYLQKLIRKGFRVAVCEQTEDPSEARKRGAKAIVRREVVRLITPGTLTEESLLDAGRHNFLLAILPQGGASDAQNGDASRDDNPAGRTTARTGLRSKGGPRPGPPPQAPAAQFALAAVDISTGDFVVGTVAADDLDGEVLRLDPSEILVPDNASARIWPSDGGAPNAAPVTPFEARLFSSTSGERDMLARLGLSDPGSLGTFARGELAAIGGLLKYVELTQIGATGPLKRPDRLGTESTLIIDAATRRNLELERTTAGERSGSLVSAIDRTVTPGGARELARRLSAPLCDVSQIAARLDAVAFLRESQGAREAIRARLKGTPDIARAAARLGFGRGGPRDLVAVREGLRRAADVGGALKAAAGAVGLPPALAEPLTHLDCPLAELADELGQAIVDEPPLHRRDGGFVRDGYHADLDENRGLRDRSRQILASLQARYQDETGVASLKIRHNNMLGYFIEVTRTHGERLLQPPFNDGFRHRQTMANAYRFSTDALEGIEGRITAAGERAQAIEDEVFRDLAARIATAEADLAAVAGALAVVDVLSALASLAEDEGYVRPRLDQSVVLDIRGGRHPVVEQAQRKSRDQPFIANDCLLGRADDSDDAAFQANASGRTQIRRAPHRRQASAAKSSGTAAARTKPGAGDDAGADRLSAAPARRAGALPDGPLPVQETSLASRMAGPGFDEGRDARVLLMTGPNMSGKSTYLRQNALIVILAQMGSFVPANYAHIGIVDRLFSRVGASDDLARGRSTFMVEMVETAGILHQAGERALVILDEIGRGTATFDGLSIAWATVEHLHDVNKCRAIFATHYHELTALAGRMPGVSNATIDVREWQDEIVFLHRVVPGAADRSYGIQVAKLAGLPGAVIARAGEILEVLEAHDRRPDPETMLGDLPLFASARPKSGPARGDERSAPLLAALNDVHPDQLSPREALDLIYRLKSMVPDGAKPT